MFGLSIFFYHAHIIEPSFSLKKLGDTIKEHASIDDTVFFKTTRTLGDFLIKAPDNFVVAPQIQYYSGRCIQVVPHSEAARAHLKQYEKQRGIIFTIENLHYEVEAIERITQDAHPTSDLSDLPLP